MGWNGMGVSRYGVMMIIINEIQVLWSMIFSSCLLCLGF